MVATGTAARFPGTEDVCEDLALAGLHDAEISILKVGPETGLPFRRLVKRHYGHVD